MHAPLQMRVRKHLLRFCVGVILTTVTLQMVISAEPATPSIDAGAPTKVASVWPGRAPEWNAPEAAETDTTGPTGGKVAGRRVIRLGNVSKPEIHIYEPKEKVSDTAILIAPGGGYSILAWDLEGTEIAEWLQELGITALVVKYRVPTRNEPEKWLAPVQDLQRSIAMLRNGGIEGLSPKHIGVLGFSAGGNASARVATARQRFYEPVDDFDRGEIKPDFAILVYPAWLVKNDDRSELIDEISVNDQTPPMFFAHAADDRVTCMSSVTLFGHLATQEIPSALHVFASGGHGFGGRQAGNATDTWPSLCEDWMRSQNWIAK